MHGGRLAELARQVGRRGRGSEHRAILLMHKGVDGEADAGVGEIDDRVDALLVHPTPRNRDADVGLVLMIGENDLDLEAPRLLGEVLGRELSADERSLADLIGERTGEVTEHADLDRIARNLGRCMWDQASQRRAGQRGPHEPRKPSSQRAILLVIVRARRNERRRAPLYPRLPSRHPDRKQSRCKAPAALSDFVLSPPWAMIAEPPQADDPSMALVLQRTSRAAHTFTPCLDMAPVAGSPALFERAFQNAAVAQW